MESLTPMMRQYHRIKLAHPDVLLFFRLGDFYEMFYDDALVGSRELEITLTSRHADREGNPIPMCGIPYHAVNSYVARLLRKGFKVAICDQVEDPRTAKGLVRREVTRILTPGTAVDEGVLESKEHNFLAALCSRPAGLGAAFLEVSTGEFWAVQYPDDQRPRMEETLLQFQPREVLVPEGLASALGTEFRAALNGRAVLTSQADWVFNPDYARRTLLEHFQVGSLEAFGLDDQLEALGAAGALLYYVRQTQRSELGHITSLKLLEEAAFLKLDDATVRNLELLQGLDGNRKWTLLATLDYTRTGMGGRLLRSWMLRPLMDVSTINRRLDAVQELAGSVVLLSRVGKELEGIQDLERLVARVSLAAAGARELVALRESLRRLPALAGSLSQTRSPLLAPPPDLAPDLVELLDQALVDDPPAVTTEGGMIRPGYHAELDELRSVAEDGKSWIARIEAQERQRTGIASLKVRYNKVFGYFIEVTKANLGSVPDDYIRKQTLAGAERFITPELKEYEDKVLGAEERMVELERELFLALRRQVSEASSRLLAIARRVAEIDVLAALAEAAHRNRYVRPRLDESLHLKIRGGRHPVVELQSDEPFVPNDLECDADGAQLMVLTGPNMGGKSTYLRQNALIVLMAQMGSFVPATEAHIGLVDRIYTRVGASDNLARGRSTFMVEMIETARILHTATRRSLILLDEVGRGTATFDGLSIAWAVAEYLLNEPERRARTLFATHYQELTRLEQLYPAARNYCVTVGESGGHIVFFHKVLAGIAAKSYGIEVARLAGVPQPVIQRAREILERLERKQLNLTGKPRSSAVPEGSLADLQKALF